MEIIVTSNQLRILTQILNYICNCLNLPNFEKRTGFNRDAADQLLERLFSTYSEEYENNPEKSEAIITLDSEELLLIKKSIPVLLKYLDEIDYGNLLGCNKDELMAVIEKFI